MPSTVQTTRSGNQDIDALLEPERWAVSSLTYSFPTLGSSLDGYVSGDEPFDGFQTLNTAQKSLVRYVLGSVSAVTNLTFTELAGGAGDLRFAETGATETAHAYTPTAHPAGGDVWFSGGGKFDQPVRGDYAFATFLHEIGHALGLKHGHEADGYGALTSAHDSMEFSVMTYRAYVGASLGAGYANELYGFAQSFMMYDIAALQHMYGANYGTNSGNTVYKWGPDSGQTFVNGAGQLNPGGNRLFLTIWDGGGTDSYDLSGYNTAVTIDLRPGAWTRTSQTQTVDLGTGHYARGNIANALLHRGNTASLIENAIGGSANDVLTGNQAANRLDGRGGADSMTGGAGNDVFVIGSVGEKVVEASGGGTDTVESAVSYTLASYVENLKLTGTGAINGTGNGLANALTGNAAANRLNGGSGNDVMNGGGGNDVFVVGSTGDKVVEVSGGGSDTVESAVSYALGSYVEKLKLTGTGAINGNGNSLANVVTGNAAANALNGGGGSDTLSGGAGADRFYFNTALGSSNIDKILDFDAPSDTIHLDRTIFKGIAASGTLGASAFHTGTAAHDSSDRIIYDSSTGKLLYDAEGTGAAAAIHFATLGTGLAINQLDFTAYLP